MNAEIMVSADEVYDGSRQDTPEVGNAIVASDLEGVHVSLAGEARTNGDEDAGAEFRCVNCGDAIREDDNGAGGTVWVHEFDSTVCYDDPPGSREVGDTTTTAEPERVPLSWANSAGISLDEESDTISVRISVGDPRGAFVMSIYRHPETGELLLSLPSPGDGFAHMSLTKLRCGYYRIGG